MVEEYTGCCYAFLIFPITPSTSVFRSHLAPSKHTQQQTPVVSRCLPMSITRACYTWLHVVTRKPLVYSLPKHYLQEEVKDEAKVCGRPTKIE